MLEFLNKDLNPAVRSLFIVDLRQRAYSCIVSLSVRFDVFFQDLSHNGMHEALAVDVAVFAGGLAGDADFADTRKLAGAGRLDHGAQTLRAGPKGQVAM